MNWDNSCGSSLFQPCKSKWRLVPGSFKTGGGLKASKRTQWATSLSIYHCLYSSISQAINSMADQPLRLIDRWNYTIYGDNGYVYVLHSDKRLRGLRRGRTLRVKVQFDVCGGYEIIRSGKGNYSSWSSFFKSPTLSFSCSLRAGGWHVSGFSKYLFLFSSLVYFRDKVT